jgi:hypothetical protein
MMGPGFGNKVADGFFNFLAWVFVLAFVLGALTMWGLPLAWDWLRPLIHAATG